MRQNVDTCIYVCAFVCTDKWRKTRQTLWALDMICGYILFSFFFFFIWNQYVLKRKYEYQICNNYITNISSHFIVRKIQNSSVFRGFELLIFHVLVDSHTHTHTQSSRKPVYMLVAVQICFYQFRPYNNICFGPLYLFYFCQK